MPLYEYECAHCGTFTALRKMSESQDPAPCEFCGDLGQRILSAPRLAVLDKATRIAHERNEKSAHAPRAARRSSCGCTGGHTCKPATDTQTSNTSAPAKQKGSLLKMQTKKTARPWMLGH
ncbi:FmdB family zinc ribbon protein [Methylobacillus flagellatus]|uniref:FmdB family zinc ribbon protein n=1 Tax=Methylobacillus flagellatus TaxID=405 RepID=UPI0010F9CA5C|nr:zinc ribbon domain-containing protein [Methylobacillus flagellatus]